MSKAINDARQLIQSRLAEIAAETRQLERAVASMAESSAPRRPGRPPGAATTAAPAPTKRTRSAVRERRSRKRAPRGRRREELLAAIKAAPGARPSELAETMGVRPTQVSVLIAKARAEKLIVKRGDGYALTSQGSK